MLRKNTAFCEIRRQIQVQKQIFFIAPATKLYVFVIILFVIFLFFFEHFFLQVITLYSINVDTFNGLLRFAGFEDLAPKKCKKIYKKTRHFNYVF